MLSFNHKAHNIKNLSNHKSVCSLYNAEKFGNLLLIDWIIYFLWWTCFFSCYQKWVSLSIPLEITSLHNRSSLGMLVKDDCT